jgi:hypothetical protein
MTVLRGILHLGRHVSGRFSKVVTFLRDQLVQNDRENPTDLILIVPLAR